MKRRLFAVVRMAAASAALAMSSPPASAAQEADADAALALAKKGHCLKCHSVEKRKNAPSYREIATKFKGRADAEQVLFKHLTAAPVVKSDDGDEAHATLPTQDEKEILNVIRWVLSR